MHRLDFSDVRGNDRAVRALAASAESRIGVVLTGPPGIGKTMIARRAPGLLGPLADREAAWLLAEYSALGLEQAYRRVPTRAQIGDDPHASSDDFSRAQFSRPFRAPHHTVSALAMSGSIVKRHRIACPEARDPAAGPPYRCSCEANGGKEPTFRAGECHLARFGVLLLDDLIEFSRLTVETIAGTLRAMAPSTRPWVIATATACPCGWRGAGDVGRVCSCTPAMLDRWTDRLSQSLRILEIGENIPVLPVTLADLRAATPGTSTEDLRARIAARGLEAAS